MVPPRVAISGDRAHPGDAILVRGTLGDHGVAVMSGHENLSFGTDIRSDTAALHGLVAEAALIGEVVADPHQCVQMQTRLGGGCIVDWLAGEQLPGIC